MSNNNQLASYFKDSTAPVDNLTTDLAGRTFFDIISECKDFNDRDLTSASCENVNDQYYDMWPVPSGYDAQKPLELRPFQLALNEILNDPIKLIVNKYLGSQEANKRILPNADSVIADANGLQILIKCGSYRSVLNLTHKILTGLNQTLHQQTYNPTEVKPTFHSPYSIQIWFIRIAVLMKLKYFKEAELELKQFENFNRADLFYESHVQLYPNRKGSMVPFGLRVLNAELAQYLARSDESISSLYKLLNIIDNEILNKFKPKETPEEAFRLWNERKQKVQFSIVNILINRKNYEKALDLLLDISNSNYGDKCSIWSCIGKVLIQIGDVLDASEAFIKAKNFSKAESKNDKCRNYINLSLLKIATGQYKEAYEFLKEAYAIAPDNPTIINNISFCLFYSGNLKEAIGFIEKHINSNPKRFLNESLLFNLCTLYELESSKAQQKKANLLYWLNIYAGDGFNEACIQLQHG